MARDWTVWLCVGAFLAVLSSPGCDFSPPATDETDPLPRVFDGIELPTVPEELDESSPEELPDTVPEGHRSGSEHPEGTGTTAPERTKKERATGNVQATTSSDGRKREEHGGAKQ